MIKFQFAAALPLALFAAHCVAHDHGEQTEEQAHAPVDAILWIHIVLQAIVWGILFPVGMVLGLTKSRWHVPLQATGFTLTFGGYVLGHSHKGRQFHPGAHSTLASILVFPILAQLVIGIYLKLHIHERGIRPYVVKMHSVLGKSYPILAWTQMLFGAVALQGYCRTRLGQCIAHYIMGTGFIGYGIILVIIFLVGEEWVRRSGKSPEFWDSCVITAWGIVNTFTEHHGDVWSVKDMQHTILGALWWTGGALGIFLSRRNQRNVVPAAILILTGWAMSSHAQALEISTMVHGMFGKTLILAGLSRMLEVCYFVPRYSQVAPAVESLRSASDSASDHRLHDGAVHEAGKRRLAAATAFRHLTPFLLVSSGLLFMSATDEELHHAQSEGMDHVTYVLIIFSISFMLYTFIVFLIHLYSTSGQNGVEHSKAGFSGAAAVDYELQESTEGSGESAWYARVPVSERIASGRNSVHVLGEDEEEEDDKRESTSLRP